MKVQIKFSEHVEYDVDIEVPDDMLVKALDSKGLGHDATAPQKADALRDYLEYGAADGSEEGLWFDLMEEQHPEWVNGHGGKTGMDIGVGLSVSEREVEEIVTPFDSVSDVLQRKARR